LLNRWGVQNRRPLLKRCSLRLCEQPILEASKAVHYTSEQERIEAEELGFHAPAAIVPNPVPPVSAAVRGQFRRRLGIPESAPLLLFLSRIDAKKGLDLLIPAFRHVRAALPDAVLVIAGSGDEPLTNRMKALARAEGLDESAIYWPGFVQGAAKEQAFADADLFVLPSYSENFGVAPIEAASAGLPLLLSDHVGVHVEVAAAEAGRVVPCDVTALAREAVELLRAPSLRQSMGEAARALALERYSLEAVSRQMVALYRKVLSQ
ncbi:MAG TPA: hypothetical protein DEH78_15850, partial [Solibacterales bacterium]|nr:hypothetical protein [Bryobacterales bacterium]